jgi:perosamine synthetase
MSFVSTAHAVMYNGGRPVFCDIDIHTLCLDPDEVVRNSTGHTRLIIPVHFAGYPCEIPEGFDIVEDASHAMGSHIGNKNIQCFSFHPVKNLATLGGGAIALNGKNIQERYEKLISARWCGISDRRGADYDVTALGWNYYMNEISAVIGIEQLKHLDENNKRRYEIAQRYSESLEMYKMPLISGCSYHMYWIRVKNREKFRNRLAEDGIETGTHYIPIDQLSYYNKHNLPNTDRVGMEIVTLPIHANMSEDDVVRVIRSANA